MDVYWLMNCVVLALTLLRILRFGLVACVGLCWVAVRAEDEAPATPNDAGRKLAEIAPLLRKYCWECHAEGSAEGKRAFDAYESDAALLADRGLWWAVLKNVRSDIMPPGDAPRPTTDEKQQLTSWIKQTVFGIDPADPDPGRITIRRLNREEYRNTIRDLTGVDFDTSAEFPPDDSGHGFDNVADALSLSPLLMEKYLAAAETIVDEAVPRVGREIPVEVLGGERWRNEDRSANGGDLAFYDAVTVARRLPISHTGEYRLIVEGNVQGGFEFDPGRCRLVCRAEGQELWSQEFPWAENKPFRQVHELSLEQGERAVEFTVEPLTPREEKKFDPKLQIRRVRLEGPLDPQHWKAKPGYERFFTRPTPPAAEDEAGRREYTREILSRFALQAFRRPIDEPTLDRLIELARAVDQTPDRSFEESIGQAITAILTSPRFLFRFESPLPAEEGRVYSPVDEYALASRLSYFLWSTMPDQKLFDLAGRGELRNQLDVQLKRMLADSKSDRLIDNFVGQWLQTRDVEGASIDPLAALGHRQEYDELRDKFFRSGRFRSREPQPDEPPEIVQARERLKVLREIRDLWSQDLRRDMQRETEQFVSYVIREDQPLTDLLKCDYTFLNERLAKHYGIEGVTGDELRKVTLPAGSHRGGLLTQGTFLIVTSNPSRTSPVKRGLFILDNILGTPAPPAPGAVPELEKSQEAIADQQPTLREVLELHRREPLCKSCHERFDPLGLAFENFNALGMWRDTEGERAIDPAGQLITGESFTSLDELQAILRERRRFDFYRCLSERMLTYAIGRGLEPEDEETLDQLVRQLDDSGGKASALIGGIVRSAPFQRLRPAGIASLAGPVEGANGEDSE
jgi:hypothetical protein